MSSSATTTQSLPITHLALRQHTYAAPPTVERIPIPQLLPGTAVLRVHLATIISYTRAIYDGTRAYQYPVPLTLGSGGIGRVVALGPDATTLKIGYLCFLDVTMHGRDDIGGEEGAVFLSAIHHGHTDASKKLMNEWRDGTYAEFVRWPLENCHILDEQKLFGRVTKGGLGYKMEDLMFIPTMLVSYGGLGPNGIDIKPGETIVVAPATGSFGSAAVHLCLELGAGRVICMGRNTGVLEKLKTASGKPERVSCVPLTGDWEADFKSLESLGGKIDVFFDISPRAAQDSGHFKAAIMALSYGGRVCFMGGLRGDVGLPLSKIMHSDITIKGKWMFEPVDVKRFIGLVEMGVVRMYDEKEGGVKPWSGKCIKKFKLHAWKEGFDEAERLGSGGFVVFEP